MKICKNCGCENSDSAEICSNCKAVQAGDGEEISNTSDSANQTWKLQVPSWIKWLLWLAAWASVAAFTALNHPEDFRGTLFFPFGFCGMLPINASTGFFIILAIPVSAVCGWLLYLKLTIAIQKTQSLSRFSLLYLLLCILLLLNVAGCRRLIDIGAGIH